MNQESDDGRCAAVYLCAELEDSNGFSEIYHTSAPPALSKGGIDASTALARIYDNIRILLDEDQGSFHEVYLCSLASKCLERLESYASATPTIVLIELTNTSDTSAPLVCAQGDSVPAYPFLRGLAADVTGARYQRPVMPFALVPPTSLQPEQTLPSLLTQKCLDAGAVDILRSPLGPEDLDRLVGHVKEITRPPARLLGGSMAQNLVDSINSRTAYDTAKHRPDIYLSDSRKDFVETRIGQWEFPAQDLNMDELTYAALQMLERMLSIPGLVDYRLERPKLVTFLLATRRQYKHERQVYYHNWRHAVDVTQSIFVFLVATGICPRRPYDREAKDPADVNQLERLLTPLDGLILLVSAIGHDVGHPGVNNAFLIACNHPLSQMYNDRSVLENYHCAAYSQLLRRSWPALSTADGFRSTMISNILATDMQRHFEYMTQLSDLKRKLDASSLDLSDWKNKECEDARLLLTALLMKAADISNIARPFDISCQWAQILMSEFSRQAQLERELQIPTCLFGGPPKVGDELAAAQSQKGFMDLFGMPLFQGMTDIMPGMTCANVELLKNHELWQRRIETKIGRTDSHASEHPLTFASVTEDEVREAQVRHHKSEPTAVPVEVGQGLSAHVPRRAVVHTANVPTFLPAARFNPETSSLDRNTDETEDRDSVPCSLVRPMSPPIGPSSRRSSKDVALEQYQHQSHAAAQLAAFSSGTSKIASDGGWQIRQSYPGSRRGSKDESLTTILLTDQGSQIRSTTPLLANATSKLIQGENGDVVRSVKTTAGSEIDLSQHSSASISPDRNAVPSVALHQTDGTKLQLNNTQRAEPVGKKFVASSVSDSCLPHTNGFRANQPAPRTTSPPGTKSESPYIMTRITSGDTEYADRTTSSSSQRTLNETRSRSRLRSLKFWKKRREISSAEQSRGALSES